MRSCLSMIFLMVGIVLLAIGMLFVLFNEGFSEKFGNDPETIAEAQINGETVAEVRVVPPGPSTNDIRELAYGINSPIPFLLGGFIFVFIYFSIQSGMKADRAHAKRVAEYAGIQREFEHEKAQQYYLRGKEHLMRGELDKALNNFDEAIFHSPQFTMAFCERAHLYQMRGDYQRALADLERALVQNPKLGTAYYYRGLVRQQMGDRRGAERDFEEAAYFDPQYDR